MKNDRTQLACYLREQREEKRKATEQEKEKVSDERKMGFGKYICRRGSSIPQQLNGARSNSIRKAMTEEKPNQKNSRQGLQARHASLLPVLFCKKR